MKYTYNKSHPSRRLELKIGDKLWHTGDDSIKVTILGWNDCRLVWHKFLCQWRDSCPNGYTIMKVNKGGFNQSQHWCLQHSDSKCPWRKVEK